MKKFSALEYLHPNGSASRSVVLGKNCPEIFQPELQIELNGKTELFILAPSAEECSTEGWLETAVKTISHQLSKDGVCYVLVPPRWRGRVLSYLGQSGLVGTSAFWHFPKWSSSQYIVPIERNPAEFVIDTILPVPAWKRALSRQMFRYPGTRQFLNRFWDRVGIVVRRPGARPLFEWLFQGVPHRRLTGTAVIRNSWRRSKGASIAYGFLGYEKLPVLVAKTVIIENTTGNLNPEAQVLEKVGSGARDSGARVPEIIQKQKNDQHTSLLLSFLPGRAASDLLASSPSLLSPVLREIVEWLERWHRATVTHRHLTKEQFEQALLVPLARLSPYLENADRYRERLLAHSQTVVGNSVPLVAGHNDLTMANVLWDEHNPLGLVDWETGCPEGWPLLDFYYAVTDAVRIAANFNDWLDAFKSCYVQESVYSTMIAARRDQLQSALGISPGFAELCFHACWLHHASNEHQVSEPREPRPFFGIVQWLALHESNFNYK